jgi:hypothetical protein
MTDFALARTRIVFFLMSLVQSSRVWVRIPPRLAMMKFEQIALPNEKKSHQNLSCPTFLWLGAMVVRS